jgi:hypothetical protein
MSPHAQIHSTTGMPPIPTITGMADVRLVHLRTPGEIARVLPLRDEIDLSAHTAAGRSFHELEKKETSWASSGLSSSMGS